MQADSLGIWGWDTFEYLVHDLDRSRNFYTESFGLPLIARSSERHSQETGEEKLLFGKGGISIACIAPTANGSRGSRAERWLKRHPDGVAVIGLRVKNLEQTYKILAGRQTTFTSPIQQAQDNEGNPYASFEIASPLGDVRFRFVERHVRTLPPGFDKLESADDAQALNFQSIDHVTSNMLTLEPWISWLKEILGMQEYWRVQFHTGDGQTGKSGKGSGLASIVMWDPESKIKMANNEPAIPNFEASQVYTFVEDNCGPGVQHIALHVPDIQSSVGTLKQRGLNFLAVPDQYYEMLPSRLQEHKVTNFTEDLDTLRRLGVLVDGDDDKYLLQIFMQEGAVLYDEAKAGPFFFELIQRKGATLFGEGNFRALFEAIEREQAERV